MLEICFAFLFIDTYGLPVFTKDTKSSNQVSYVSLVDQQNICAKYGLEPWPPQNDDIRKCCSTRSIVQLKTRLEAWKTRNDVNGVSLFYLSYLITLMVYQCPQCTPKVQIKYFMFDWSFYRPFVLNKRWKPDPFQIMIFVYVCSTWSIVELKSRF
jgi:hypothetical protein